MKFAQLLEKKLLEHRVPRDQAILGVLRAAQSEHKMEHLKQLSMRVLNDWKSQETLEKKGLDGHEEAMLALYFNTLEDVDLYRVWRKLSQWTPNRSSSQASEEIKVALDWMTWIDQSLALIDPMEGQRCWRVVKGFRYPD